MMQYLKRQAMKLRSGLTKGIVLLLCLATLFSSAQLGGIALIAEAAEGDTVTVTVNYVYKSNSAMVAQPYTAQIAKGAAFQKTLEIPQLLNYSVPGDQAKGLGNGIELTKDSTSGKYSLNFDLAAVNADITVTLYYVAGQAKYTVKHYYQNLADDEYTMDPAVVEVQGDIDAYTEAVAINKTGFRCKGVPQTTVAADGTTVVEIYYDREYYTVTFDVNGGINGPEPIYAKYGTNFKVSDIAQPTRAGYTFLGWADPNNGNAVLQGDVAVEGNVTYTALWQPERSQADYTIVIWGQNANDDEYSYLNSYEAWGNVGSDVTWNGDTLISHVHTDECWDLTCGQEEHTHTADCLTCGQESHTRHDTSCYVGVGSESSSGAGSGTPNNPSNGYVARKAWTRNEKVIYINGTWYNYTGSTGTGSIAPTKCHTHTDACYGCGKTEHTHTSACGTLKCGVTDTDEKYMRDIRPDSKLWKFKSSETVTVDANGSTVLNVYFDRVEFTLTFYDNNKRVYTIQERWGKDISGEWPITGYENGERWKPSGSKTYTQVLVQINVMPAESFRLDVDDPQNRPTYTMNYYVEVIDGTGERSYGGKYFTKAFTVKAKYNRVTEAEDFFPLEGFTKWRSNPNFSNGAIEINGNNKTVDFYYTRNSYKVEFYSVDAKTVDKTENVKYEAPLGGYDYTPVNKPNTVEPDAIFVGWYLNPECTGEPYDLSAHTMPAHDIALYAKWVNGLYTVRTFTDDTMETPYTYDGYNGVQEKIVKYTLATAPTDPKKDGYVFIGWFYKDGNVEKPFSFTMPITKDYDLYPKFSEPTAVTYTVHYYIKDTTTKVADDRTNSVMIGTTVTERAKMGTELNLVEPNKQNKYYPTNTSTSVIINQIDQEIIFYYTEATSVKYTVKYQDANGKDLIDPVEKTTEFSTVTEYYVSIPGYAPRQYSITKDMSADEEQNVIIFIYDPTLTTLTIQKQGWEDIDENQTFLFRIKGVASDPNTKDIDLTVTVHGNGKVTITDLPVGDYTVTEVTDWSWRYTPDETAERSVKAAIGGTTLVYKNSRTQTQWLDGDNYSVNHFNSKNR